MNSTARGLAVLTVLVSLQAAADCEMPTLVAAIPDGATARQTELLAAQTQVKAYIAAMDEYIACQNEELRVNGDGATSEYLYQMSSRIAFARDEVDAVATRFNDAVEAFRANQPPTSVAPAQSQFPPSQSQFPAPQSESPAAQPGLTPGR
jgi:hypothetical protein